MAKKKNKNKNKNLNSPRGKVTVIKIESPEMELLKRRDRLSGRGDLLIPYAFRQVQAAQERARLRSQATPVREIRKAKTIPVKETVVTANGMELKTVSSIRELGYTVTLSREARWNLLNNVVIPRVGKEETIKHIKFLITMNRNQPNKMSAVYEWEHDLRRLEKVHRKKRLETRIIEC